MTGQDVHFAPTRGTEHDWDQHLSSTPPRVAATELLTDRFRCALDELGLGAWPIYCTNLDVEVERLVEDARQRQVPVHHYPLPLTGAEQPQRIGRDHRPATPTLFVRRPGIIHLTEDRVAVARWFTWRERSERWDPVELWAAASLRDLDSLHARDRALRHDDQEGRWQVMGGVGYASVPRTDIEPEDIILPEALKQRFERDVSRFFDPSVRHLHEQLNVPYRRGVLLHGPPGCGKTSLIRLLGAKHPEVAAILLSPDARFDDNNLNDVFAECAEQGPVILVIEDLDTLFTNSQVTVSGLLNKLDGAVTYGGDGLLIVATTNHPDQLDPALNNRPGRFDVVLEVPLPDTGLRRAFFERRLQDDAPIAPATLAEQTRWLSFAHLAEVLRAAGLHALHAGRSERSEADLREAVKLVHSAALEAETGFRGTDGGFGFRHGGA